jgi:hypothetical protein
VGCVTEARLTLNENRAIELDTIYAIVLKSGDGVVLGSDYGIIQFDLGQRFRIIRDPEARQGPYRATTVEYWYRLAWQDGPALLSFHWTPETTMPTQRTFPHLHVEAGLLGPAGAVRLRSFNKLHVPTGRVSCESIIRFLIEEMKVPPIKPSWQSVLEVQEARFHEHRRLGLLPRKGSNRG